MCALLVSTDHRKVLDSPRSHHQMPVAPPMMRTLRMMPRAHRFAFRPPVDWVVSDNSSVPRAPRSSYVPEGSAHPYDAHDCLPRSLAPPVKMVRMDSEWMMTMNPAY